MQETTNAIQRNLIPGIVALLVLAGCGQGNVSISSSSSASFQTTHGDATNSTTSSSAREWNLNGPRTSTKTITKTHDGVTRKLETTPDVEIQNGQITKFPKAALVKIEELGGPGPRQAELRENAGKLELWIKDRGSFRRGSAAEEAWLKRFLTDVTPK